MAKKSVKSEKSLNFWKIHNAKTPFLNWLKVCTEVGNYMYFWMENFSERYWMGGRIVTEVFPWFYGIFPRYSAGFFDFPVYLYMVNQFWAHIWIPHQILHRLQWFEYFIYFFFHLSVVKETQNAENNLKNTNLKKARCAETAVMHWMKFLNENRKTLLFYYHYFIMDFHQVKRPLQLFL